MIRFTITIIAALAIVVAAAIWFSDRPGEVSIEWQGWLIEMSVGRFVLAAAILLAAALIVIGFFRVIGRTPGRIRESLRTSRRERGYRALTQGMVAVAAGDPDEANRQARRADVLLEEPPLTMLLSAQAAQLNGDEEAATRYFSAMLERPETAFLGVRGLLIQAQKNNDRRGALEYAERAYQLQPKTPWVLNTMFDLQIADGRWRAALSTLEEAVKRRAVTADAARDRRATVLLGCSGEAEADGDLTEALKFTKRANSLAPEFLPAVLRTADLMIRAGKTRPATRMIQDAWGRTPHPELARLYGDMDKANGDPLKRVKRFERLLSFNLDHRESHIALAEAALAAALWGEARNHLEKAAGDDPPARVCRMMADLEERSGDNPDAVRTWLLRASDAPPDPAWICGDCGAAWGDWTPVCGNCQALGTLTWEPPARAPALGLQLGDATTGTVLDQNDGTLLLEDEIPVEDKNMGDAPDDDVEDAPTGADDTGARDAPSRP
ncbi:MAG: HemY protein [Paracoccaceae bacterium]|jgi:HemY protein